MASIRNHPRWIGMGIAGLVVALVSAPGLSQEPPSINSTSQNRASSPVTAVPVSPTLLTGSYKVFAVNDLGMHCGDLDTRVASILPPFNVLHAQVIQRGSRPIILHDTQAQVYYSAAYNPLDPALAKPPVRPMRGGIYKTNFWDSVSRGAYDAFYPPVVTPLAPIVPPDRGLPVPDLAELYPSDGSPGALVAAQQDMPGIGAPYVANAAQGFARFDTDLPFFANFPFGYRLKDMRWFVADGIPITAFDDFGRINAYPLMRVEARRSGQRIATLDAVVPISGEADCKNCHAATADGGNGTALHGIAVASASQDTELGFVPDAVSVEWASDINILRLHDLKHATQLESAQPVVCQSCHYTPALDLANVGPLGGSNLFADPDANGRQQRVHSTMSRVMHSHHSQFITAQMPPPNSPLRLGANGKPVINTFVRETMAAACYQCHPGKDTQCLRGAMYNGGMVCQDCHGNLQQVGNDFSGGMSVASPFPQGADLSKRVPWAHEPGCQSCHTGDTLANLTADPAVIASTDGVRLLQAYRVGDADAKPIVASNRRFAENAVDGKQVLYRLSLGHGGVFCEGCHGNTHSEWPNANPAANDNVAANQLQGHTGTIMECATCHTGSFSLGQSLKGPHGMHPVGNAVGGQTGYSANWVKDHHDAAEHDAAGLRVCATCHGKSGEGTVLAKVAVDRPNLECEKGSLCPNLETRITLKKGTLVGCGLCHSNPLSQSMRADGGSR